MLPQPTDWARLAAFLDGEGYLGLICKNQLSQKGDRRVRIKVAEVRIINTNILLMEWLQRTFGGKVRLKSLRKDMGHRRPCHDWVASYPDIDNILRSCMPYFVIKREQAEIILALRALVQRKAWKGARVSEEEHAVRQKMADRIKALNNRGAVVPIRAAS